MAVDTVAPLVIRQRFAQKPADRRFAQRNVDQRVGLGRPGGVANDTRHRAEAGGRTPVVDDGAATARARANRRHQTADERNPVHNGSRTPTLRPEAATSASPSPAIALPITPPTSIPTRPPAAAPPRTSMGRSRQPHP